MIFMDLVKEIYYGSTFKMIIAVLCSYLIVYVAALILTRIRISLRSGTYPTVDQIAHSTLLICFILCTALPVFFILKLARQHPFHTIPFAIAILIDIMILTTLFGKRRQSKSSRRKKHA